jgi:hypothetical protein
MMLLESCLQLTTEILVKWVIFDDITLEICMDLAMSYATRLWHWLVSALAAVCRRWSFLPIVVIPFVNGGPFCWLLWLSTFGTIWWEALWTSGWLFGEWWWCHEKLCCAAGCSDLQNRSTMMDLTICHSCCQIPSSLISSFVVGGFYSKVYSKD